MEIIMLAEAFGVSLSTRTLIGSLATSQYAVLIFENIGFGRGRV